MKDEVAENTDDPTRKPSFLISFLFIIVQLNYAYNYRAHRILALHPSLWKASGKSPYNTRRFVGIPNEEIIHVQIGRVSTFDHQISIVWGLSRSASPLLRWTTALRNAKLFRLF